MAVMLKSRQEIAHLGEAGRIDTSPAESLRQWSMTLADVTFFAF